MSIQDSEQQRVEKKAVEYFQNKLYCSEAILKAFRELYDLGLTDEIMKIATGFGVGLGASKCCCGCITGGTLVLSLASGRVSSTESEQPAFEAAAALHDQFKDKFKATCCRVLTNKQVWGSPEHHKFCEKFVEVATVITDQILQEKIGLRPLS